MTSAPIIITGGAKRLGLAAALALKKQYDDVIVTYRSSTENLSLLAKHSVRYIQVDFDENDAIEKFIGTVLGDYPSVRAIVHNASDWMSESDGHDPEILFDRMMHIHAKVPYLLNTGLAPALLNYAELHGRADIVHMTDFVVERGSDKHIAYAASKAALANLMLSFSKKLAPKVKVNAIAPALLMFNAHDDAAYREKALKKSLMALEPGAEELVGALQLLLNSQYITGRTIPLDGGRHLK